MTHQMSQLENERAEQELQMKRLKQELHTAQLELNKSATNFKDAQNQIQMLSKERGPYATPFYPSSALSIDLFQQTHRQLL